MYHPFTIAETLKSAWSVIKKNYITLLVYSVISLVLYKVIEVVTSFILVFDNYYSQLIETFVMMLVQSYLALSFYRLILTLMDREYYEFSIKDIIPSLRMALSFITIAIFYGLLIVLLVVIKDLLAVSPIAEFIVDKLEIIGIAYLLLRSIFCLCFIVDEDSGPIDSLKQSFFITNHNLSRIFGLVLIVVGFIAILLLIINLIITLFFDIEQKPYVVRIAGICWIAIAFPVVQVMIMATYRKLVYSHLDVDDDVSETL
ncbi:hypothetical protein MUY27_07855 [Mucilaginibacter sp. RS28]|uniref:DUF7847 domain-containing protein n=1 Tax=Mucilaginibacter straminoryzae TaxID=2932774 RepID=A0A9X1X3U0_9SPHI|nr:hypothetical protein [Mucilaginibacter straminoryzae]MCJ8209620.1 hypothetical protein [Mucilaginibacter straminoryzae]